MALAPHNPLFLAENTRLHLDEAESIASFEAEKRQPHLLDAHNNLRKLMLLLPEEFQELQDRLDALELEKAASATTADG